MKWKEIIQIAQIIHNLFVHLHIFPVNLSVVLVLVQDLRASVFLPLAKKSNVNFITPIKKSNR